MNATIDGVYQPPYDNNPGHTGKPQGGDAYIFVVGFFCVIVVLISLTYTNYICKRSRSPPPSPTFFYNTTTYEDSDNHHLITFSRGLDDDVLVTFPTFLYSDVKMPHKGDTNIDTNGSECSICLADYKHTDVVRLLPECSHLFHVKCIDTWLKAHPTCPMCRNSPLPGTNGAALTSTELSH